MITNLIWLMRWHDFSAKRSVKTENSATGGQDPPSDKRVMQHLVLLSISTVNSFQ